ncbi:MAG TPA: hypothetical protein VHY79_15860 [Rhizomicrobium sp.]|jgi:hypothetical protein|nr:hypothetical protein [Rhizomicrobium sp.]
MKIKTASWFTKLPPDHFKIGISRGVPRGTSAGYRQYAALNPGPWFNSSTIPAYLVLYRAPLAQLNHKKVATDLLALDPGKNPVLLCFETVAPARPF